ncbi:DEAD/DEAH box helicase [Algisphaera agarilytica]|uniref:Helicase n=1 Tax=Algisphaera agarilytica TaxID=1385975 RepID=A0A7X0H5Q8_9BACT|nr:DEAD/DEAH box helicase [Algisphaera agarilytica]MBB6429740.1 helicase [Algisphaera agarilytica]
MFTIDESIVGPELASWLKCWNIKEFTDVQQLAVNHGVHNGTSAIVCAPTSSGKTLVGELALASALKGDADALYLVSHKALAEQKYADFSRRFTSDQFGSHISVAISTGDREDGDIRSRLLISTYEKALGLLLSGRLRVSQTVIIADELQLLGDKYRGASVETLCTLLRQRKPKQFVGLTATAENPDEVADWMGCEVVHCAKRDVVLQQHICYAGQRYTVEFGQDEGSTTVDPTPSSNLHSFVRSLISRGQGPVLVFTETRNEARRYADEYSKQCNRDQKGIAISNQLELFSEPTESSQSLKSNAERRVAFHSADLTPDERNVIEQGFDKSDFDVCFATSTLSAGVNFPFRTVVFSKLFFTYRDDHKMSLGDYRNMSGRAGRLGLHPDGNAYLLPKNNAELAHANKLVAPANEKIISQLVSLSMRRTILGLVAAGTVSTRKEVETFFKNSFYWHQTQEHNPKLLEAIIKKAKDAATWLIDRHYLAQEDGAIQITSLGRATAQSGLLPETAGQFVDLLGNKGSQINDAFDDHQIGIIHWIASCPEFSSDTPTRFLPYPAGEVKAESKLFIQQNNLLTPLDPNDSKVIASVHALGLFMAGEGERKIQFVSRISSGYIHRLASDFAWILDGLSCISGAKELAIPQSTTNHLRMLARRIRWGVPVDGLDVLKIATRSRVPGFGRQRLMALTANGVGTIMDILKTPLDKLAKLIHGKERAESLIDALGQNLNDAAVPYAAAHVQAAGEVGLAEQVEACNQAIGTDYEDAIVELLRQELQLVVDVIDDGDRQNVPDFSLALNEKSLIIECKTVTKKPPLIDKRAAWEVVQKSADFDKSMHRVTLGKPDFDETSKKKAAAATDITLVRHEVFMEGLVRVLTGRLDAPSFIDWLAEPGVTELDRLPGNPTFVASSASQK